MKFWQTLLAMGALLTAPAWMACDSGSGDPDDPNGGGGGGGGGGGVSGSTLPGIGVKENNLQALNDGDTLTLNPGMSAEDGFVTSLWLNNAGTGKLVLESIEVTPAEVYELQPQSGYVLPTTDSPVTLDAAAGHKAVYNLMYRAPVDGSKPSGKIVLRSNSKQPVGSDVFELKLTLVTGLPKIQVQPTAVDFGAVSLGEQESKSINILNLGQDVLTVDGFTMMGHEGYSFAIGGQSWSVAEASSKVLLDEPIRVNPGEVTAVAALFKPIGPEEAQGSLILFSNDPTAEATAVDLKANSGGPCIALTPKKVDFGGKLIGKPAAVTVTITSCGDVPLEVRGISLDEDSSTDFSLDLSALPGVELGTTSLTDTDAPIVLQVNEMATFDVTFVPDEINPLDGNGQPIPDLGLIHITSSAFISHLEVEAKGFGVEVECPTAVIIVQEGEEVIPQTKLHLIGSQSYAATGSIGKYEWTVEQPVGSQSVFLPSASAPDPTFEANVAGTYVFRLRVWDQNGEESCVPGEYTVFVNPDEAIHVELLWDTPNDFDQTDEGPEAGSDLDLHFRHPFATGEDVDGDGKPDGWFDQPFDCFWFNPHPNWGSLDPMVDDDPGLDRDDTDGAGPENVNLNIPEDGLTYYVGVHYWNDHQFGPSKATVRIYIRKVLVFQLSDVELVDHDLWEVATVAWPSGDVKLVTDAAGNYKIIPNYQHPFFFEP